MPSPLCNWACGLRDAICGTPAPTDGIKQLTDGVDEQVTRAVWGDGNGDGKLHDLINICQQELADLFDTSTSPTLSPANAGEGSTVDETGWDTEKFGTEGCDRAQSLKDDACGPSPDHDAIGVLAHELDDLLAKLKTRAEPD